MSDYRVSYLSGHLGDIALHHWPVPQPRFLVLLMHGYGEHMGRYHHVARRLNLPGGYVFGPDHLGHGQSHGERVLIADYEAVVDDVHLAVEAVRRQFPDLPLIVVGHSMGGMIATRYVQRYGSDVAGLVLSGPLLGEKTQISEMHTLPAIPDTPLDVTTLSRDPKVGSSYQADPLVWHGPFKRTTLRAISEMLTLIHAGPGFGSLPTLWLHGEGDRLVLAGETLQTLNKLRGSDFDHELYTGAQHEIFNETNRDEVLRRVNSFIVRVLG